MKENLALYLKTVSADISVDLISTQNIDKLCTIAQYFPTTIVSIFGFESSLSEIEPIVDFFFCSDANQGFAQWLMIDKFIKEENYQSQISSLMALQPIWQKITDFCTDWSDDNSPVSKVEDIWLEFDFEQTKEKIPQPSFFFSVEHFTPETDFDWWIKNVLAKLIDNSLSTATTKTFTHCLQSLPVNVSPFQMGVLLPRNQQLRLYITFVSYQQLLDYLTTINWQGNLSLWEYLLSEFSPLVSNFQLQIEVSDHLCEEIAIELYPRNLQSWRIILNYLTKIGFCVSEKKDALLSYTGMSKIESDTNIILDRQLGYLKMNYQPQTPIAFKAYLMVNKINKQQL